MSEAASLAPHRYLSLATFRRAGGEVRTPVWFATAGGRLYVFTGGESGKVKRLRHSPRARVAPCDVRGNLRGRWQDATARLLADPGSIDRARAALREKYGWQMLMADLFAWLGRRLHRRAWIEIEVVAAVTAPGGIAASRR